MQCPKILLPLEEQDCTLTFCQIIRHIFKTLINMVGEDISFDYFLTNLKVDEKIYILALRCTLQKPTLFFKCNPKDKEQMYLRYIPNHCGKQI
jgi:hypothetical protein